jgi:predicted DNA-binding protein (MmcQ/YjbR family)
MNYDACKLYLLSKPEVMEVYPFGSDSPSFKICHKVFATLSYLHGTGQMNLKCDPDEAERLRDTFDAVVPGHHMNKRHWNTLILNDSIPEEDLKFMMDHSYSVVVDGLPQDQQDGLVARHGFDVIHKGKLKK